MHADQRVSQPAGSPVSDALFFLEGNPQNATSASPSSLEYYLAILQQNAVDSTSQKDLAGESSSPILSQQQHQSHWHGALFLRSMPEES